MLRLTADPGFRLTSLAFGGINANINVNWPGTGDWQ